MEITNYRQGQGEKQGNGSRSEILLSVSDLMSMNLTISVGDSQGTVCSEADKV